MLSSTASRLLDNLGQRAGISKKQVSVRPDVEARSMGVPRKDVVSAIHQLTQLRYLQIDTVTNEVFMVTLN